MDMAKIKRGYFQVYSLIAIRGKIIEEYARTTNKDDKLVKMSIKFMKQHDVETESL